MKGPHMLKTAAHEEPRLLRALGIVGWNHLEPVILAALATESPLLLIGPHGSAKTMVLTRIAGALGLNHRHYNASLLNFDDLIGFPVPDNGRLVYLQTPATIWDAESVLFDEISRCRPELQNKLFPIVHERIVQGIPLDKLRHRWGAMNPPPAADGGRPGAAQEYAGAEPLDIALADRFGFILPVPALGELDAPRSVDGVGRPRTDGGCGVTPASHIGGHPPGDAFDRRRPANGGSGLCADPGGEIRRGRSSDLDPSRGATREQHHRGGRHDDRPGGHRWADTPRTRSTWRLRYSLPDQAWGAPMPQTTLLTAHRAAWQLVKLDDRSEVKAI